MTETARLVIAVDSTQATSAGRDLSALERQAGTTEIGISKLAKTAAAAFAAMKLGGLVEDAVTLASRYDQLGLVMKTVGANTGRTTVELAALDQSLQKAGISAIQSRNNIIKMMSANIDLSQATKLARLAQDAAVVGNTNSSEAFERLIKGIQSAEKETLETLGLNVNFAQSYEKLAAQLGKNVDRLTTAEKTQAGVNAAMEAGKSITGAYEASLDNANKKLQSSTRYVENLKVSLGGAAQPAFGAAVDGYVGSLKLLSENVSTVSQVLETGLYVALGRGAAAVGVSVKAFAEDLVARRASAAAALSLAEAEVVGTAATLRSTSARQAAYASHVQVTAAAEAHAAAELRLIAAQKASAVAGNLAAGVGGRLLGILGGPVGLAVMAGATALSFMDFGGETSALKARLAELDGPLDGLIAKFTKLSKIEQVNEIEKTSKDLLALKDAYAKSGEEAGGAFVESLARGMSGPRRNGVTVASGEIAVAVESVKKAFQDTGSVDWSSLLSQLSNVNGVSAEQLQIIKELAGSREAEARKIAQVEAQLNALTGSYKANTDAASTNAIVTDTAGLQYIAGLKKQADFAGKLTEVEKVRISISKGYAGTLSKESQDQALAYAAVKDKADDAAAATKNLTSEANKQATALENQRKALREFIAESDISTRSATEMAAAYISGADSVRELAIEQKAHEEALKTGAGSYDRIKAALIGLKDAEDSRDIAQSIANMRVEVTQTLAQATATLQGKDALEAFNIQKSMSVALSGKNIEYGSKEYELLLQQTKAQLEANKALEQAGQVEGIVDRLNPQIKLLKDFTAEQEALNAAIARYPENAALYQDALAKLGNEYEVNRSKATIWGQMTEGAIDRIDEAFASAWGNIGSGAESLWDNLKKGFKQTLGEIAHMLTTKPLLASISNWLTGTDNGQGLGSVWSKLLGSAGGSGGGGGLSSMFGGGSDSNGWGGMVSLGKNLYSAWSNLTGVGSSIASGYASGGVSGAISGGAGYYGNMLSNIATTLGSGFTSLIGGNIAITGATAAGTAATTAALTGVSAAQAAAAAATVGAQGITTATLSAAVAEGAASIGTNIGVAGATTAAASSGIGAAISSAISSAAAMWPLAIIMGMYQSGKLYSAGVRPDASAMWDSAGGTALGKAAMLPQTLTAKYFEINDGLMGKVVGGKMAAILSGSTLFQAVWSKVGSKLFGTGYQTKDVGIELGVDGGVLDAQQYIKQKKKGGLISGKSKTRYLHNPLDAETQDALGSAYNEKILNSMGLFSALGVQLSDAVLDGLDVAATRISTQGKTPEAIQEKLDAWFGSLGDSAVAAINAATNSGLQDYNFEALTTFVNNLYSVNAAVESLGVKAVGFNVAGGKAVETMIAVSGGIEALTTGMNDYYSAFTTEMDKSADSLAAARAEFTKFGFTLPDTRDGLKEVVKGLDLTTEIGQNMFSAIVRNAKAAADAYTILEQRESAYRKAFFSEAENAALAIKGTTAELKALGVTLPASRSEYRKMVEEAAKSTTDTGKAMYDTLMNAAGAASTVFDELERRLNQGVTDSFSGVQRSISAQQKAATAAYNATNTSLSDMSATAVKSVTDLSSVSNSLESALKSLRGTSDDAVKTLRAQAQATLQSALATARAGGSLASFTGLEDALDTVSDNNTDLYGSMEDFARDQGRTANVVAELNAINGKQLTAAEKLQKSLEDQISLAKKAYDDQMTQFDRQLEIAQAQMDAFNGIDTSVKSVEAAIKALNGSLIASLAAKPATGAGSAMANTAANNATVVDTLYQQLFGRTADAGENKYWADRLGSGNLPYAEIVANMTQYASAADKATMAAKGHATGGLITGPGTGTSDSILARLSNGEYVMTAESVRMFGTGMLDQMNAGVIPAFATGGGIGEAGPQLEVTGPSRIFNANQAGSGRNGGDSGATAAEVRELRREIKDSATYTARLTKTIADGIDTLVNSGMQIIGTVETKAANA